MGYLAIYGNIKESAWSDDYTKLGGRDVVKAPVGYSYSCKHYEWNPCDFESRARLEKSLKVTDRPECPECPECGIPLKATAVWGYHLRIKVMEDYGEGEEEVETLLEIEQDKRIRLYSKDINQWYIGSVTLSKEKWKTMYEEYDDIIEDIVIEYDGT